MEPHQEIIDGVLSLVRCATSTFALANFNGRRILLSIVLRDQVSFRKREFKLCVRDVKAGIQSWFQTPQNATYSVTSSKSEYR